MDSSLSGEDYMSMKFNDESLSQIALIFIYLVREVLREVRDRREKKEEIKRQVAKRMEDQAREERIKEEIQKKAEEIKQAQRTRLSDLNLQLDSLLSDEANGRREDDPR